MYLSGGPLQGLGLRVEQAFLAARTKCVCDMEVPGRDSAHDILHIQLSIYVRLELEQRHSKCVPYEDVTSF